MALLSFRKENKFKWHDVWFIVSVYINIFTFSSYTFYDDCIQFNSKQLPHVNMVL